MPQTVKNLPAIQETQVWSLGQEDPLEKGMTTNSSILAWRIPWTEEPGGLQFIVLQRVGHNWVTKHKTALSFNSLTSSKSRQTKTKHSSLQWQLQLNLEEAKIWNPNLHVRQKNIHLSSEELEPNRVQTEPCGLPGRTESEAGTWRYRATRTDKAHPEEGRPPPRPPLSGITDYNFQMWRVSK